MEESHRQQETERESIEKEAVNCDNQVSGRLKAKTHAVIYNSDLPIHVHGTSLLNHLDISGSTEVSSLLVDPLTTLVLIG